MSAGEQQSAQSAAQNEEATSLLDAAITATKQTEQPRAKELIETLVQEAMKGTVTFDKDIIRTINQGIAAIDEAVSKQLAAVMHHPEFQKLEGSWRGLHYLVSNSETGEMLKLRVLNASKKDISKDLERAVEFDQSTLFKKIYESEFGLAGGAPYGALIGNYEWDNTPDDISALEKMSGVAASAFAPFLTAPSANFFGFDDWEELSKPRDLAKIFDSQEYIKWNSFRQSEDSRFVTMCMPRTLARLPYGAATKPIEEFNYEEVETGPGGQPIEVHHGEYCWMNTAFVMGAKLTDAFAKTGWCTAIRGVENGGKVEGLPVHVFKSSDGDSGVKCPTEVAITDRREAELSKLGFLSLCHFKDTDYSVFFGGQTTQKPKQYHDPDATANAEISARLPYIMASSRFAHYLKVIARDKIGSFMERDDCERWLNDWIHNYVCADERPSAEVKARLPLAQARVEVTETPGKPGAYNAVAYLRPWLQMEELTASLRMVASIPQKAG